MGYHGIAWYIIISQWLNTKLVLIIIALMFLFCSYKNINIVIIKLKKF